MFRIDAMSLHGLEKDREEGLVLRWIPEGFLIEMAKKKIEKLSAQYESQLQNFRSELDRRPRPGSPDSGSGDRPGSPRERGSDKGGEGRDQQNGKDQQDRLNGPDQQDDRTPGGQKRLEGGEEKVDQDGREKEKTNGEEEAEDALNGQRDQRHDRDDGTGAAGKAVSSLDDFEEVREELVRVLPEDQREKVDSLVSALDQAHQQQMDNMHRQHLDDVEGQVKSMQSTLEEIYSNQLDLVRTEHQQTVTQIEQDWSQRLEDLRQDYDREIVDSKLEDSLAQEDTTSLVTKLNQRLTDEHRQIIQKIEEDIGREAALLPRKQHHTADSQTDTEEDAQSSVSAPVTQAEIEAVEEKQKVLGRVEDVKKSLEEQLSEIAAVRAQMLSEYEQLVSTKAEMMSSQTDEVERLQQEMEELKAQHEHQLKDVREQSSSATEAAGSSEVDESHSRQLEELKQYYETKMTEMEQSYSVDIEKLKQEHSQLIAKLHEDTSPMGSPKLSPKTSEDKQREYVRKTTMLTALSDDDEATPPSSPADSHSLQGRIKQLESKLEEREQVVNELKKRLEAETTSAEDLHGKLCDYEENLRTKAEEAEELRKLLVSKDERISVLEKAALEERGEKETETSEDTGGLLEELKARVKVLEEELSASKETNKRIQDELNQMDAQHGEAVMKLKEEMEAGFKIQLQEELEQLETDLNEKYMDEISEKSDELETYKRTEKELKEKLSEIQEKHETELAELAEKSGKKGQKVKPDDKEGDGESEQVVGDIVEAQLASPSLSVDRDSLEASIRQNVREEILEEYETSIDKLKNEYEDRISELNSRVESLESEKSQSFESELLESERESVKSELAQEYKEKLDTVTNEYETKLKTLQDIVDKNKESPTPSKSTRALPRSRSLDLISSDRESRASSQEPQSFVGSIKKEYEQKIKSLQTELAMYQTRQSGSPQSPMSPMSPMSPTLHDSIGAEITSAQKSPSGDVNVSGLSEEEIRRQLYDEIYKELEAQFNELKSGYEMQIDTLKAKLVSLETDSGVQVDNRTREEIIQEYEAKLKAMREEYEEKLRVVNEDLEKAKQEKTAAEQKVKADMFVWHEEVTSQLKRQHEQTISQLRKEYEEKMELIREEMQEEFDQEKEKMTIQHKKDILDMEDRYDTLVEGLRSGEAPEVAELVQDKFDMELEMAKTLIQQECDETIESEQLRMSEQHDKELKNLRNEMEQELQEQKQSHQKELAELRETLVADHEAHIEDLVRNHEEAMKKMKQQLEELSDKQAGGKRELMKQQSVFKAPSVDSKQSIESEIEEEISEKVTTESYSETSDKFEDDDDDDSGNGGGNGGDSKGDGGSPAGDQDGPSGGRDDRGDQGPDKGSQGTVPVNSGDGEVKDAEPEQSTEEASRVGDDAEAVKQKLAEKIAVYEVRIAQMKLQHEEEVTQLRDRLSAIEEEHKQKIHDLEQAHEEEVQELRQAADKLKQPPDTDAAEDLETAHQQELSDLESRLGTKHVHEFENLEARHQSRLADVEEKYKLQIEELQRELTVARQALDQYPDTITPEHTVPIFQAGSTTGSSRGMTGDFTEGQPEGEVSETQVVPELRTQVQSPPAGDNMETQGFDVKSASEDTSTQDTLQETLEEVGVRSLDTSMDQLRGTLRGVDDTHDDTQDQIHFSEEEEEEDKSTEEDATQRSDRSTPSALLQTLGYGGVGPTVKSLDDTIDESFRASDREDMASRIKELEAEVEDLRHRLDSQLTLQDVNMERLDREKEEESNLIAMLQDDIERLNHDRESLQGTNEHLLGLLSDTVKTYMSVEESIHSKLKVIMEKSGDLLGSEVKVSPGDKRRTPPPGAKKSPSVSPGRLSPARPDDPDNPQETSILSNVTDEGLDLTQRISDSIFQGPELASDEEDLLTEFVLKKDIDETGVLSLYARYSGSRLRSSVTRLLDMIEETTSQLLDTRQSQSALIGAMEMRGEESEHHSSRVIDLEERIKEEVERKDFLALELHKAEGLIEGYTSEREQMDLRIQELEELKETLVLDLETQRNKLHDLTGVKEENEQLKREMKEQRNLMTENVGEEAQAARAPDQALASPDGEKALMLEVSRLNSENREKDQQLKQVHERFESRVRELETSGEDTEHHFSKLLDEKKQEVMDLKLQVDALEKQLKSKKQFIEEQSAEREQEREDYQTELDRWKKMVHDLEKQNGNETRMHREIEDLSDQLQTRIDQHNEALVEGERMQRELRDRDLSIKELKAFIQQLEQEIQDKNKELEQDKQKLQKLEEELTHRPYPDDDSAESVTSGSLDTKKASSLELDRAVEEKHRLVAQLTVEEELRQAAQKSKEELVREKHVLQTQLNEYLVQISALRNQLDEMRHRKDFTDTPEAIRRLEMEREKSEDKDKQISELRLQVEQLGEKIENREQQIVQLKSEGRRTGSQEIPEYDSDREVERQMEKLREENSKLKAEMSKTSPTVTDMSSLSQQLLEEKNQEIDQLSDQVQRLQADFSELRGEKGVENMYVELESLREEIEQKDKEVTELQAVHVSQAYTDHSLTPDSSLLNVGASFSEKTSIAQEMEESEAKQRERLANLETELSTLKATLQQKEEDIVTLQTKLEEKAGEGEEDVGVMQTLIHEKEELIVQLTVQVDGLQTEVDNLSDFQNKLQEDFDTVQTMLEEKDREIESLTQELSDRPTETTADEHSLVIKHEVEIAMLKKDLREKDNVVEEKMEEMAEITDKLEILEAHINKYKEQERIYDDQIAEKEREISQLKKQLSEDSDFIVEQQKEEIAQLKDTVQKLLGRPPSPPGSDQGDDAAVEEESLEAQVKALGKPPAPPADDDIDNNDVVVRLRTEIEKLKQQIMDGNLSEDDKFVLIRELRLQNETLKRQIDAALKIRPPSPPRDEDETAEIIEVQKREIQELKRQLTDSRSLSQEEKEDALMISSTPIRVSEEEKDRTLERRESEVEQLREELEKITESITIGQEGPEILKQKVEEVVQLKTELDEVKRRLSESSQESIQEKDEQLKATTERLEKLEEELKSAKDVRSYEDEIELKEKEDEIEELQAELESYRKRGEGSFTQSIDLDGSVSEFASPESKDLVRSMSFYKEQYEEKCSEARQLQVALDLVKDQLQKARSDSLEDNQEEIELFKAELDRMKGRELEELKIEKEKVDNELKVVKQELAQSPDERVAALEKELEKAREETALERLDSVQAINNLEEIRDRRQKERRGSIQQIHDLEAEVEQKSLLEKQLSSQVKQLTEELTQIKRQFGIEDKPSAASSGRSSESRLQSQGSFELSNDVDTLQQQVLQFKQAADKTKEILSEKQKYQTQVVKLEIQQENLQKQMRKELNQMEDQLREYKATANKDVGLQLHATQEKLEKTTEQLMDTNDKLQQTEGKLSKVVQDMQETQQDLWKTSSQLALTSGKLQETEEKLKLTRGQVTEREDQIHQLQSELQHMQQDIEQEQTTKSADGETVNQLKGELTRSHHELSQTQDDLTRSQQELEEVQTSLKEAVEMSERQLTLGENKDREFVKLKLDIQQTVTNKDKTIKEQKKDLKERDSQIEKLRQESLEVVEARDRQISELRDELSQASSRSEEQDGVSVATLKTQLQNQVEVIETLQSDLVRSRSQVEFKEQEIAEIVQKQEEDKKSESDTVSILSSQIVDLQREIEELRSAASSRQGEMSRSPASSHKCEMSRRDDSREESPQDQNGQLSREQIHEAHIQARLHSQRRSGEQLPWSPSSPGDQTQYRDPSMEEDSGHQSWGTSPQVLTKGQVTSPRQQTGESRSDGVRKSDEFSKQSPRGSPRKSDDYQSPVNKRSPTQSQSGEGERRVSSPGSGQGSPGGRTREGARRQQAYDEDERYIGENGRLYDRDGNIRPRYQHTGEGQMSRLDLDHQGESQQVGHKESRMPRSDMSRQDAVQLSQSDISQMSRSELGEQYDIQRSRSDMILQGEGHLSRTDEGEQYIQGQIAKLPYSEEPGLEGNIHLSRTEIDQLLQTDLVHPDIGFQDEAQVSRSDIGERFIQGQAAELAYGQSPAVVRVGDHHSIRTDEFSPSSRSSRAGEDLQSRSQEVKEQGSRSPRLDDIASERSLRPAGGSPAEIYSRNDDLQQRSRSQASRSPRAEDRSPRSIRDQVEDYVRDDDHHGSHGEGDTGVPEGLSSEAERCIHQLRKELLITKTALIQLQRGAPLDQEYSQDGADDVEQEVMSQRAGSQQQTLPRRYFTAQDREPDERDYDYRPLPDEAELSRLRRKVERLEDEVDLYRTSSDLTAQDFVQKVMTLKDELAAEHQRHVQELTSRANQDTETQLATMRIKYTDEIEHIKGVHSKDMDVKLRDQQQKLERKHKGEVNRLVLRHQEEVEALKTRGGVPLDDISGHISGSQAGVGLDGINGHGQGYQPMSRKLQTLLERLNREGIEVLTISELEFLQRSQSQTDLQQTSDVESLKAGWENERTALQSNIQSLKDLLAQTHKLQGMDKDDDNDDDHYYAAMEGSDWRAELLRAIGYVFAKERDTLLAELRSHVLSYPNSNSDEMQRLEQKIRTMESHHHSSLDQIFGADRQSMLAEIRDLRAHATISRMHTQEERDRQGEKLATTEEQALKKERQMKKQEGEEKSGEVQLLEFKIMQEKLLQEDLRTSLDSERNRSGDLSTQLNQEKISNLDLQATLTSLQVQVSKLKESLEREQSRYVSVTTALEEEKTKSLNLSELLESERQTLNHVQTELESLRQQGIDPQAIQELETELSSEREIRHQLESQHEVDMVTVDNLRQEVEMERRHLQAMEGELGAKVGQLQKLVESEKNRASEIDLALERERTMSARLQQSLEVVESHQGSGREQALVEDLQVQLDAEQFKVQDLRSALLREQTDREEMAASVETEKAMLKENLAQERSVNKELKHELDKVQFERLEAVNKFQKERDVCQRLKHERDQMNEDLRQTKSVHQHYEQERENEKLTERKIIRQADREKEEYRMKMHENELEVDRLTQKIFNLEEQLAESQENELKAIREQEKLRNMRPLDQQSDMVSAQTSPRRDVHDMEVSANESVAERNERLHVYRSQLESMCQSLHYIILRCREQLSKSSHSVRASDLTEFDALQRSLVDLLSEVKQLQEMEGDFMSHPAGSVNERILRQNEELTNFIVSISEEKTELRNTMSRLEEEVWHYRQLDTKYQELQRSTNTTDKSVLAERADWAKERLSLQMALTSAEREIDMLQSDLRVERERRVAAGITDTRETDKVKIEKLFGKYLRAESFRKMLIYQKKYLLVLLGGFQDTEETTLALLSQMGAVDRRQSPHRKYGRPLTSFRGAVRAVIAISRMKYLVKKWKRATRVGSEVVSGSVDQSNGYMPQSSSYTPPRHRTTSRISGPNTSSTSSPSRASFHSGSPHHVPEAMTFSYHDYDAYSSSSFQSTRPATTLMSTPPTKDYHGTKRYASPSSGARRKILTSTSIPAPTSQVRFASSPGDSSKNNGDAGYTDDYIHRLESLNSRLGTIQNGSKLSWKKPWR